MNANGAVLICHHHLIHIRKALAVALLVVQVSLFGTRVSQVVTSQNHILCRDGNWRTVLWCQDVVHGKHQESGFCLSFYGQRNVNRHLVSIEVGVERGTNQRVQLNGFTFYQYRFECLNS